MATITQTEPPAAIELSPIPRPGKEVPPLRTQSSSRDDLAVDEQPPDNIDRKTMLKLISVGFSFFVAGANDGSVGPLIPYILREYDISTALVTAIYGANFFGWVTAAFLNTHLFQFLSLGAMLLLGAFFQVAAHALRCWGVPPFALFTISFWLVSVGQAFQDAHGNTFVAGVKGAHRWLAFIHAMYMAGCLVSPFVATAIASQGSWFLFYTFPLGIGVVNMGLVCVAFWDSMKIEKKTPTDETSRNAGAMRLIKNTFTTPSVWILSIFYFFYLGAVLTASGWVVEYLVQVRDGDLSQMGYVPAGFSGGALLGRLLLAEPTHRFGDRRMVAGYIIISIGLQIMFWLVPNIIAASIAVSFIGFFTGPLFATGIARGSKLFPRDIQATALAFLFVFAQMGGSLFPVVTGVVASSAGVKVLQPILVALLVATFVSWMLVPMPKSQANAELHQE